MNDNISELVRYHRKRSGLTQLELANMAGVGKTVIFDIEHGKDSVQWNTMHKVLQVLNISVQFDSPLMTEFEKDRHAES